MTRRLLCALCALLLFLPAAMAEESVIAPAYAVPEYVEWLLETARGELGTAESRSQTTKYGAWAGNPSAEWCAEFLCWCVSQTDSAHHVKMLNVLYPNYSGSNTGRDWYLAQGRYVSRRGVVTGWGTVHGRTVFVYAHDFRIFGGALGEAHATKIHKIMDMASNLAVMTANLENLTRNLDDVKRDVDEIKASPKNKWDTVVKTIITVLVTGFVAYLIAQTNAPVAK